MTCSGACLWSDGLGGFGICDHGHKLPITTPRLIGQSVPMAWGRKNSDEDAEFLFDPSAVDLVSVSADESTVELHIVTEAQWSGSDAQITSLQQKIHNYVGFAADGQLAATYPEVAGLPWQIVVACHGGSPDARSADVIARTREPVQRYGGDLIVRA